MASKTNASGSKRAPLGTAAPRATKIGRGRTDAAATPLSIRTQGVTIPAALGEHLHAKLGARLGKFAQHVERVTVRFEDINGPRGGIDTECRVKVALVARPSLVVSARERDARRAFDAVCDSLTRAVRRELERAGFADGRGSKGQRGAPARALDLPAPEAEAGAESAGPKRPSRISTRKSPDGLRSGIGFARRAQARATAPKSKARAAAARGRGTR
ncbi:MAG: HPF/RaiA family ribosome-associated protein [Planctomycetes bacterium]|nr:HPF/RaiA family ribosome-associated protein [Planctomycetota bacterium]